ncbi:MAG TPA: ribonuclease P protein component [Thermoanaerobaculia bacterium]|jgi:ribonuclease P protein component
MAARSWRGVDAKAASGSAPDLTVEGRSAPRPAACSSEGRQLGRRHRLRRSAEYLRCYRQGRKRHGSLVTIHVHPNEAAAARLGITASRKVGKAVVRHRAKRRVREVFRCWEGRAQLSGLDVVVHLKPPAGRAGFAELRAELEELLSRLAAWNSGGRHQEKW